MNASREHLVEDIRRLSGDTNSRHKCVVHLHRLSQGRSGRDWKPDCARAMGSDEAIEACRPLPLDIIVFYEIPDRVQGTEELYVIDRSGARMMADH